MGDQGQARGRMKKQTALDRLRAAAPEAGPQGPFVVLILDEDSCRCLALGAVNSRAQLAATKALAALEPLGKKESA